MNAIEKKLEGRPWLAFSILASLILLLFFKTSGYGFVSYDDDLHIIKNPILSASFFESLKYFWTHPYRGFYIPMTYTAWSVLTSLVRPVDPTRSLGNIDPSIFHLANVSFHILNACLVYLVFHLLLKRRWPALFGAIFFAIHPIQVESVAWATGLKELISGFFAFSSLYLYLADSRNRNGRRGRLLWCGSLLCYVLGLLSKPGIIILPLVMLGLDRIFGLRNFRKSLLCLIPFLLAAVPFALMTPSLQPPESYSFIASYGLRPFVAVDAMTHYVLKILFPFILIPDYGRLPELVLADPFRWLQMSAFIGISIFLIVSKNFKVLVLWLLFLISFAPVWGVVRFAFQDFSTVADHYLYLALFVCSLAVAIFMAENGRPIVERVACLIFLGLGILTWNQVGYWKDTPTLAQHTLKFNPNSFFFRNNLAVYYEEKNELARALQEYRHCLKLRPRVPHHLYNVGNLLLRMDHYREAQHYFEEVLKIEPGHGEAHFNLGLLSEFYKLYDEAKFHFEQSIKYQPNSARGYIKLAGLLEKSGDPGGADLWFREATRMDPLSAQGHYHLGKHLEARGRKAEAIKEYREALGLSPGYGLASSRLNLLGAN